MSSALKGRKLELLGRIEFARLRAIEAATELFRISGDERAKAAEIADALGRVGLLVEQVREPLEVES